MICTVWIIFWPLQLSPFFKVSEQRVLFLVLVCTASIQYRTYSLCNCCDRYCSNFSSLCSPDCADVGYMRALMVQVGPFRGDVAFMRSLNVLDAALASFGWMTVSLVSHVDVGCFEVFESLCLWTFLFYLFHFPAIGCVDYYFLGRFLLACVVLRVANVGSHSVSLLVRFSSSPTSALLVGRQ